MVQRYVSKDWISGATDSASDRLTITRGIETVEHLGRETRLGFAADYNTRVMIRDHSPVGVIRFEDL